ncbi:phage baseplate assembly protein [Rhodoferax sp. GW822-FHT02A01]|uniref:phage baseplate assembly protein n=1 Tax=Rhodoferax sp. GW822-FHT02A01 TaxID=3141537 RepID=UPI00315C56FB
MSDDTTTILVGGIPISEWTSVRVTRSVERVVSDFDFAITDLNPGQWRYPIVPGDACQVFIGNDLVLTGYIDRYTPAFSSRQHSITVSGRSKTQDIVDCSAVWEGSQLMNGTVKTISENLCTPFGVSVVTLADVGPVVPRRNLNIGETPFEVIEPLARLRGLLIYDDVAGNLVLSSVGTDKAASGFKSGENVQSASMTYAMDGRYRSYSAYRRKTVAKLLDTGKESNLIATVNDFDVPRRRTKFIVAETYDAGGDVAARRAAWEMARRKGRSASVHLTCDSWRDSMGALWAPNTLAPVSLPSLGLDDVTWLISEVVFLRDAQGTRAQLTLMDRRSFLPEPYAWPFRSDLAEALRAAKEKQQAQAKGQKVSNP